MVVTLTTAERNALVGDLPLDRVGQLHPPDRRGDDGGTECIQVWSNGAARRDCLWGGIEDWHRPGVMDAPPEMIAIWKRLAHFSSAQAVPWVPDHIEVRASPWQWFHSVEKCGKPVALPWPKRWPKPGGKGTIMPTWGWAFSLDATDLLQLRLIEATRPTPGCTQPVSLRGAYYELSHHVPLPHVETLWRD